MHTHAHAHVHAHVRAHVHAHVRAHVRAHFCTCACTYNNATLPVRSGKHFTHACVRMPHSLVHVHACIVGPHDGARERSGAVTAASLPPSGGSWPQRHNCSRRTCMCALLHMSARGRAGAITRMSLHTALRIGVRTHIRVTFRLVRLMGRTVDAGPAVCDNHCGDTRVCCNHCGDTRVCCSNDFFTK